MKKINYQYELEGRYTFYSMDWASNKLIPYTTKVIVIGETDKSYEIRLTEPIRQKLAGDKLFVSKEKVKLSTPNPNTDEIPAWNFKD